MWRLPARSDRVQVHQCGDVVDNPSDGLRRRRHRHLAVVNSLILESVITWRGGLQSGWGSCPSCISHCRDYLHHRWITKASYRVAS